MTNEPLIRVMALHALAYCERLFYLEEVEGIRVADKRIYKGRILHDKIRQAEEIRNGAYDVHDQKRLKLVAKLLEGYGTRLQYSIFSCRLNDRQLERLRWEITKITTSEDRILYVRICRRCVGNLIHEGRDGNWEKESPHFRII